MKKLNKTAVKSKAMNPFKFIDETTFAWWLTSSVDDIFKHYEKYVVHAKDSDKHYIFIDNSADILVVAHLDHVNELETNPMWNQNFVMSRNLDDRLGAALAANCLSYGLKADILFTDHEEIGKTTAQHFTTKKQYNWVVEFDRGGTDYVTYGWDSKRFDNDLTSHGLKKGRGSFSDIKALDIPGDPARLNLGIAYVNAHCYDSYADLQDMAMNMHKLMAFYVEHSGTYYEAIRPVITTSSKSLSSSWSDWDDAGWEEWYEQQYGPLNPVKSTLKVTTKKAKKKKKMTHRAHQCDYCNVVVFEHQLVNDDKCPVCGMDVTCCNKELMEVK